MSELSIFVDESGDFGEAQELPAYYLVTFLFHEQDKDISQRVESLQYNINTTGFGINYIHTAPLIRKEDVFHNYSIDERRRLLFNLLNFTIKCPIMHETIVVNRKETKSTVDLSGRLSKQITAMIKDHENYFRSFDRIVLYYDNGQHELAVILNAIFSANLSTIEFRIASPHEYYLLQSADLICTIELLKIKKSENRLSRSETHFFYKPQELKKTFIKSIDKKHI